MMNENERLIMPRCVTVAKGVPVILTNWKPDLKISVFGLTEDGCVGARTGGIIMKANTGDYILIPPIDSETEKYFVLYYRDETEAWKQDKLHKLTLHKLERW